LGKYPKSRLRDKYSDWHWQDPRFKRDAFLSDVDGIWVEIRDGSPRIVCAMDLKEPGAEITWAEGIVYNWLEEKAVPVYIVFTTEELKFFTVKRCSNGKTVRFNQEQYIEWDNNLRGRIF